MFRAIPFQAEHAIDLLEDPLNDHLKDWYSSGYAKKMEDHSYAFTGFAGNEKLFCVGIVELWPRRGYLWSVLSSKISKYPVSTHRGMISLLKASSFNRVEMDVPVPSGVWHRRAVWLGFEQEIKVARKYFADGSDASIYAWVRD